MLFEEIRNEIADLTWELGEIFLQELMKINLR